MGLFGKGRRGEGQDPASQEPPLTLADIQVQMSLLTELAWQCIEVRTKTLSTGEVHEERGIVFQMKATPPGSSEEITSMFFVPHSDFMAFAHVTQTAIQHAFSHLMGGAEH